MIRVNCEMCGNSFERSNGRYNEAVKMGWKHYCSKECQKTAKTTVKEYICANHLCGKTCMRSPSELCNGRAYCSRSCAAVANNAKRAKCESHKCFLEGCDELVISRNPHKKFCSDVCYHKWRAISRYNSANIIEEIKTFVSKNNRLPLKFELIRIYVPARKCFGTWNAAIRAAGYDPNPEMYARHHIANDGHKCDSLAEKIVDDYLFARGIVHQTHVPYPWKNGMKCDFLVGDKWVEIFGLTGGNKRYDELKKTKLGLANEYAISIVPLTLLDVYRGRFVAKLDSKLRSPA